MCLLMTLVLGRGSQPCSTTITAVKAPTAVMRGEPS